MNAEDVYAGKPDMPNDLREFAGNCIPGDISHCLQRALILSAAKEIETLRAARAALSKGPTP